MNLDIIYHDQHLVVINKPSGLLVHRSLIDTRETRFVVQILRDQLKQKVFPVHRLDKPTSGIMVFALSSTTARLLSVQFSTQKITKKYLAVVRGFVPEAGTIDYPLREQLDKIADADAEQNKPPQLASTDYRPLAQRELPHAVGRYQTARYSILELTPKTGRKHQLRRHLKHIFHPIVGDTTHGDGKHNKFFRQKFGCHRLLLHARSLRFQHPHTLQELTLYAPLTPDFNLDAFLE